MQQTAGANQFLGESRCHNKARRIFVEVKSEALVTMELIQICQVILEVNGDVAMSNAMKRQPGEGNCIFMYDGLKKRTAGEDKSSGQELVFPVGKGKETSGGSQKNSVDGKKTVEALKVSEFLKSLQLLDDLLTSKKPVICSFSNGLMNRLEQLSFHFFHSLFYYSNIHYNELEISKTLFTPTCQKISLNPALYPARCHPWTRNHSCLQHLFKIDEIDYPDIDFWYYRFSSGEYELEYDRSRDPKPLVFLDLNLDAVYLIFTELQPQYR
ncbi:hypothetical protein CRE_05140 [Caenorhabditis remanei]|uniref:Uncharacterized protein n=1 Tax=Caenorhabditis remanei TaxID=31234 RepID=E3N6A1_CAERE|nr:hypothetical protein CRE_05140 [Caenorhabditis remanei]